MRRQRSCVWVIWIAFIEEAAFELGLEYVKEPEKKHYEREKEQRELDGLLSGSV